MRDSKDLKCLNTVYVWELPVRIYHWINALCIVLLMVSGLYIGNPMLRPAVVTGEAVTHFFMGYAFMIHIAAGYVFIANYLFRLYWAFVGNEYARSHHWPWQKAFWLEFFDVLLSYLFLKHHKDEHLGHNPVANLAYFGFIMVGSVFMALTGFAMYGELHPNGFFGNLQWVFQVFGPSYTIHMLHRLMAWGIAGFVVVHLYLSLRHDMFARNGTLSSMVSGYKFRCEE
ncbi:ni/fe-hydrogenase, b-type cytochrome subunit, putative [Heliomicrobium modesticaldum Ice1]|uniref:Ni/fe-hydrogenase, b-type cytochrome subunit, putative n=1 Tax=Heliobacterium modesticaldum (strain ATCC 51547 / Ice1) TaxID=498761 RepID=B0TDW3_HELMI|nr:Ni/Fe-hydrogenase, b-type cytochrome subunit [Heliomicrobium modesticaldum]ABZ82826.1 ni/fe-hydrogenase, b-type cytochrome subunit, putative [Heliomicrobium modesticaldum Ice1]